MKIIKKILQDDFIKNNIIFFAGSMMVSVLNYAYHPILSRLMKVEDFGEVQVLLSLFLQISILISIFGIVVTNIVSSSKNEVYKVQTISQLRKIALLLSVILFGAVTIMSRNIQSFLQFTSFTPFIILAVILISSIYSSFHTAFLQGKKDFKALSSSGVILSLGRLVFAVTFVLLGLRVFGVIIGLLAAQTVTLIYLHKKTKNGLKLISPTRIKIDKSIGKELKYGLLTLAATGTLVFFTTIDVILVKHYFSPAEAGWYGGVATIARIIYFLTGFVASVLLPSVKMENSPGENSKLLVKGAFILLIMGGSTLIFFMLFPQWIIRVMIGEKYLPWSFLLPLLSLQFFIISIVNLLFYYYLALRKNFIVIASILGIATTIWFTSMFHSHPTDIIKSIISGASVLLSFLFARIILRRLKHRVHA